MIGDSDRIKVGGGDVDVIKIGDANVSAIYKGTSLIYPTVVDYLESTGTQYISIDGFAPSGTGYTFGGEINILGFASQTQWITIWGTYVNENTNTYRLIRRADTNDLLLAHNNTKAGGGGQQLSYVQGEKYTYEFSDSEYVWGEDTYVNSGSTGGDNTATLQIYGRGAQGTKARIYSFWVKKDGVLVLDLVPVKVDNVGYLFDRLTHTLYGNQGTGDFIIGEEEPPQPTTAITYTASSKLNVTLSNFTPTATAETWDSATSAGTIEFAESVTAIGDYAFSRCSGLTSIDIPSSVTSIGMDAFSYCSSLTSVTIGTGVTSIDDYAFEYCPSLTSIVIPDSVTSIGFVAFAYCSGLTSATIGNGVTSIGQSAFMACGSLTSIDIPSSVTSIDSNTFQRCSGLTSVTIPDSVTSIGERAFQDCTSLTSVTIPDSVTSIGERAFRKCGVLQSITVNAVTPPTLGSNTFDYTHECPIYVPSASVSAYKTAWSTYASRIQAIP